MEERKKEVLRVYNRKTVEGQYPNGLAYSVHLSVKENGEDWKPDGSVNGENTGFFWSWSTADFLTFDEWGLCQGVQLCEKTGLTLEAIRMTDQIAIPDKMAQRVKHHWNALHTKRHMSWRTCLQKMERPIKFWIKIQKMGLCSCFGHRNFMC